MVVKVKKMKVVKVATFLFESIAMYGWTLANKLGSGQQYLNVCTYASLCQ
jgi:hypothetical protein